MISLSDIENLIQHIWEEPIFSDVTSKKVVVSLYGTLSKKIPDKFIIIEEVFPKDELEDIWSNYEEYLDEYLIFPFLGTLGEAVICIGYGNDNKGKIFYFDFDFGACELDGDNLEAFLEKLIEF